MRRYTNECYSHKLTGKTLDQLAGSGNSVKLSVWCRRFKANFADVVLTKPSSPTASPTAASCTAAPPVTTGCAWAGATGTITTKQHDVAGTAKIMADCSVEIADFSYDGTGPDVFWWATTGTGSLRDTGVAIGSVEKRRFSSECINQKPQGRTWDQLAGSGNSVKLSIWCRRFSANFGDVVLTKPSTPSPVQPTCGTGGGGVKPEPTPEPTEADDGCAAWAGATGKLSTLQHAVAGTVTVKADCTFMLNDFSYDGTGPDVFWYATSGDGDLATAGVQLGPVPKMEFKSQCLASSTMSTTFGNLASAGDGTTVKLSVWCKQFSANFGEVVLTKPSAPDADAGKAPAICEGACPARNPNCLPNCVQLDTYFNVWYETRGDEIEIELEAAVADDKWAAFGLADPDNYGMIGADVVVTGYHKVDGAGEAKPTALDYFLTRKTQCNYNDAADAGVCPDDGVTTCPNANGAKGSGDVTLVSGERVNGIQRIRYKRKLDTGDACDRKFVPGGAQRVVWATGSITHGKQLVVNIHDIPNKPGVGGHSPLTGPTTSFDAFAATGIPAACQATPKSKDDTPAPSFCVDRIDGTKTEFDVTIADHAPHEYPNGLAWGVSYNIDGKKTPELVVERGTKYTFQVKATETHPFYITDSIIGGRSTGDAEKIFAGDEKSWGTVDKPFALEWTPDASTPNTVYYQCWLHEKLGWKIHVTDKAADFVLPADSAVCGAGTPEGTSYAPTDPEQRTDMSAATTPLVHAAVVVVAAALVALLA